MLFQGYQDIQQTVAQWKDFFKHEIEKTTGTVIPENAADLSYVQLLSKASEIKNFSGQDFEDIAIQATYNLVEGFSEEASYILKQPSFKNAKIIGNELVQDFDLARFKAQAEVPPMVCNPPWQGGKLAGLIFHDLAYLLMETFIESDDENETSLPDILVINPMFGTFSENSICLYTIKAVPSLREHAAFSAVIKQYGL